jgi:RimJ/RimL family protein N-acetyltransferase
MSQAKTNEHAIVELRPAAPADSDRIFSWANDPATRAASFHSARIERSEHEHWLSRSLANPKRRLMVAELAGEPIAVVRLDLDGADGAELSLNLAPERRGQNLAVSVLLSAASRARELGLVRLVAKIRPENERSLRAFVKAGYRTTGRDVVAGQEASVYELELREP